MGGTLVIERHEWETSASEHQLQFPRDAFDEFFGSTGEKEFHIFIPPNSVIPSRIADAQIAYYEDSSTYRLNKVTEIGDLEHAYVMIEEQGQDVYHIWWFTGENTDRIRENPWDWRQARGSQYGPGRYWCILPEAGPRTI